MEACPSNAIEFNEERGAYFVNEDKCTLCGNCVEACPFKNKMHPNVSIATCDGHEHVIKCDMCTGYEDGPACVKHCPRGALTIV